MPDGVMLWFDAAAGEGRIARRGDQYPTQTSDVESAARQPGARVHFSIRREHGVERAVEVTLREGEHAAPHHHRAGTLVGAHRPDTKGPAPFAKPHIEFGLALAGHPVAVGRAWGRAIAMGEVDEALELYAPDAVLHTASGSHSGRRDLKAELEANPLRASHREPVVRGEGPDTVLVRWESHGAGAEGLDVRCHVRHGQIAEQSVGPLGADVSTTVVEREVGPLVVNVVHKGHVDEATLDYARERILPLTSVAGEPVLLLRLKLDMAPDPARPRPALAQATMDVNGKPVRAHVAGHTMREAVDLLEQRLRHRLEHLTDNREALRRHLPQRAVPGEWRHGYEPTHRPDHFDRPADEREIVRHKTFEPGDATPDEAAFDMEQLDYDFHLFRDLASGSEAVLERTADGPYILHYARHPQAVATQADTPYAFRVDPHDAPRLTVAEARERLDSGHERFLFFTEPSTGQTNVMYVRYDGHYGLITST
jgi:hypothetical protein